MVYRGRAHPPVLTLIRLETCAGGKTRRLISMLVLPGLLPPFEGMRQHFGRFLTELLDPADPHCEARRGLHQMKKYAGQSQLAGLSPCKSNFCIWSNISPPLKWRLPSSPIQTFLSHRFIFHLCQSNLRLSWSLQLAALQLGKSFVTFQFHFGEPDKN